MPTYFNATRQPITVDGDGRFLGGGETADLDARTPEVKAAVDAGDLVKTDAPVKAAKSTASTPKE